MYLDYFGLREAPFSIAPDPRYLFMSERHREALAHLLYGVQGQGGFIVLTGEVGTGKTTICRCFLNQVPKSTDVAFIVNPKLSARELLASICDEFSIQYSQSASIKTLNDAINTHLLKAHAQKRHTVLIIDEAQNLRVDVLEQLRLLTNLETSEKKLLQIILLGQPELRDMLATQELRQLAQRVTARYHLDSLSRAEVGAYVACRLSVAGRKPRLFSDKAIKTLFKYSGGVPRLINLLADRALLGAYANQDEVIAPLHIKLAYREIRGEDGSMTHRFIANYGLRAIGASLAIVMFFALGLWSQSLLDSVSPVVAQEFEVTQEPVAEVTQEAVVEPVKAVAEQEVALASNPEPLVLRPEPSRDYLVDFEHALNSSADTLMAYVEAPTPDTTLLSQPEEAVPDPSESETPALGTPLGERIRTPKDKFQAYQSVFEAWNLNYSGTPFRLACEFAQLNGLACLHKQGNWRSLLRIDRPAVLTLFNQYGERIHLALIRIMGDEAVVSHGGEQFKTTLDEIDRYWLGEYSVVWKLPPYKSGVIRPGQPDEIEWLKQGLSTIRPDLKDKPLKEQVVEFQRAMGLVPDGIAGSMTLIQMNNQMSANTPKLLGKS
jgi:general secretion pathway protein A